MSSSHFKALLKKNLLILKRTYILSIIEILSPIIIMILFWRLKSLFKNENLMTNDDESYIFENSIYLRNSPFLSTQIDNIETLFILNMFFICEENTVIALIGDFTEDMKETMKSLKYLSLFYFTIKKYDSFESLKDYIKSDKYNTDEEENPGICFGLSLNKNNNKYTFKLHFFINSSSGPSIPSTNIDNLDPFRTQPDFESYYEYSSGRFLFFQKMIYDIVLKTETGNLDAKIDLNIVPQKYDVYFQNIFNDYLSKLLGFFVLIAYSLPLSINIYRFVKEKETRAKEGMKIMGLNELNYFLSYFLIYFIINILYSISNTFIIKQAMNFIEEIYFFFFFFLYGLVVYSLVFATIKQNDKIPIRQAATQLHHESKNSRPSSVTSLSDLGYSKIASLSALAAR